MKINKPNKRILLLCEGETEYFYAKALQQKLPRNIQRSISIEIDYDSKNDPKSIATEAKRRKEKAKRERNPYDIIWLFFDNGNWPQLFEAFQIIKKQGFKVAYSCICIEHWFILHFENCGRAFQNGDEALRYLKKIWPDYHKTKMKHYTVLENRLNIAMKRAKLINQNSQDDLKIHQKNPFFTIHDLIYFFESLEK